jgi:hypothetical protein
MKYRKTYSLLAGLHFMNKQSQRFLLRINRCVSAKTLINWPSKSIMYYLKHRLADRPGRRLPSGTSTKWIDLNRTEMRAIPTLLVCQSSCRHAQSGVPELTVSSDSITHRCQVKTSAPGPVNLLCII